MLATDPPYKLRNNQYDGSQRGNVDILTVTELFPGWELPIFEL